MFRFSFDAWLLVRPFSVEFEANAAPVTDCGCNVRYGLGFEVVDGDVWAFAECPGCGRELCSDVLGAFGDYCETWAEVMDQLVIRWCEWGKREIADTPAFLYSQADCLGKLFGEYEAWCEAYSRQSVSELPSLDSEQVFSLH